MSMEEKKRNGIIDWIDYRLPVFSFLKHLGEYRTPKNLSYMWNFGSLAGLMLLVQIVTGIFLAMQYTPNIEYAFDSVERIMRDVDYGWLLRYTHANGASFFFIVVYLHIFRGLYYGSYKYPRELLWFIGVIIFIIMMATAFMGYVLPWGQMSYWGATVITNLFSAIPFVGEDIVTWLWGGYSVNNATLNRFFVLHYLLPFILVGIALLHVISLHKFGSNNPSGVEVKSKEKDTVPFHPYYTIKDLVGVGALLIFFCTFIFFLPNNLGHPDNYIEADPMVTPLHIVPEWYFLPFYAMLRSIPDKLMGVVTMFGAIFVWFLLPWLDRCKVKSGRYRPVFRWCYLVLVIDFIALIWLGGQEAKEPYITLSRLATAIYYSYFFVALPLLSKYEKTKMPPDSLSDSASNMK